MKDWKEKFEDLVKANPEATPDQCKELTYNFIHSLLDHKDKQLDAAINGTLSILSKSIPMEMVIRQAEMYLEQAKKYLND